MARHEIGSQLAPRTKELAGKSKLPLFKSAYEADQRKGTQIATLNANLALTYADFLVI